MTERTDISNRLTELGIQSIGSIVEDPNSPNRFFIHVPIVRTTDNKQEPSNRKLNEARDAFAVNGIAIEFLLRDTYGQDIEAGLRATLLHAYGNQIRNVFVSSTGMTAHVWLEQKKSLDEQIYAEIKKKVSVYLQGFEITTGSIGTTAENNIPSNLACLRALRQIAPAPADELKAALETRGFTVPSTDWLKRKLEALRKANKVVWVVGGKYALTIVSIRNLGTTKTEKSPDVLRVLYLARRYV